MNLILLPMAGLWALDQRTAFNFMISRPLVISGTFGLIHGDILWFIAGGIFFEIIGLLDIPLGTRISNDDTFGSYCTSSILLHTGNALCWEVVLFAILISYILMVPVTATLLHTRWLNLKLLQRYSKKGLTVAGNEGRLIFYGQIVSFMRGFVLYPLASLIGFIFFESFLSFFKLKTVTYSTIILIVSLYFGYFSGFFYSGKHSKVSIFICGVILGWLIL